MSLRALAAVLLVVALAFSSCSKNRATPAVASTTAPAAPVTGTEPRVIPIAPAAGAAAEAGRPAPGSSRAASPKAAVLPATSADLGMYGLLALGAQAGAMPEDFLIGPIGDPRGLGSDEGSAFQVASSLLEGLVQRKVQRDLLAAATREELASMLGYAIEQGEVPASWRLGPPHRIRGEMVCTIRLIGTPGTAEGDLYLAKDGGSWLVSDLQVNMAQLAAPRVERGGRFFPSPYRWLLGE